MPGMRTMTVLRIVTHSQTLEPVLVLGIADDPDRVLAVFLRMPQAEVVAGGARGADVDDEHRLTQDVVGDVLTALGRRLDRLEIPAVTDGKYAAELVLDDGTRVPVRPSDGLALAVRDGAPIHVADAVLDEIAQPTTDLFPDGVTASPVRQLQEFRRFLDDVTPEDFADPSP